MFCKMIVAIIGVALMAVSVTTGTDSEAYLDRIPKKYEEKGTKIRQRRSPVDIKATLISRPEGYEEPKNWTTDSALRLMYLLNKNKASTDLQQTLSNLIDSSVAAGSSEVKLRGSEEQSVVKIDNHMRANLPSAMVDLKTLIGLLLPEQVSAWLSSLGSSNSPPAKGRGKVGNKGHSYGKGSSILSSIRDWLLSYGSGWGGSGDLGGSGSWGGSSAWGPVIIYNGTNFVRWIKKLAEQFSQYSKGRPGQYNSYYSRRSGDNPLGF